MGSVEKPLTPSTGCTALTLRDFATGFDGHALLSGVDASFAGGTLTALLGRNGSGKSTMLRALAGLGQYSGIVTLCGTDIAMFKAMQRARMLAFVGTERQRIPAMRCRDIVGMGRAPYTGWTGMLADTDKAAVDTALKAVGMDAFAARMADTLSDGEFQRIMIARALAQDTPVILLDEPTSFLDLPNRYELCLLLASLAHDTGKCVLFSTHELDIAIALADSIALIDSPKLIVRDTQEMVRSGHIRRLFDPTGRIPSALWNPGGLK